MTMRVDQAFMHSCLALGLGHLLRPTPECAIRRRMRVIPSRQGEVCRRIADAYSCKREDRRTPTQRRHVAAPSRDSHKTWERNKAWHRTLNAASSQTRVFPAPGPIWPGTSTSVQLKLTPLTEVLRDLVLAAPDAPAVTHGGVTVTRSELHGRPHRGHDPLRRGGRAGAGGAVPGRPYVPGSHDDAADLEAAA